MKIYRILVVILIFVFWINSVGCNAKIDSNNLPIAQECYSVEFENVITQIGSSCVKDDLMIWCEISNNQIDVLDYDGHKCNSFRFDEEIRDIYSFNDDCIMVALTKKLILLEFTDDNYKETLCMETNDNILEVSYVAKCNKIAYFVLFDTGMLYSFGDDFFDLGTCDDELIYVCSNVAFVDHDVIVFGDGLIKIMSSNQQSINPIENINSISYYNGSLFITADATFYNYDLVQLEGQEIYQNGINSVVNSEYSFIYYGTDSCYYSGEVLGASYDKTSPFIWESQINNLPQGLNYYPVYRGIIAYSGNEYTYYSIELK